MTTSCGHDGWRAGCPTCEAEERQAMRWADPGTPLPRCPGCHRVMTWRELDEQGACNDCAPPLWQDVGG